MTDYSAFGRRCAELKYGAGKTWDETAEHLGETYDKARSAGRRFKDEFGLPPYEHLDGEPVDMYAEPESAETEIVQQERRNILIVYASGAKISSADELMEYIGLDRDVWGYNDQEVIKWAQGAKAEEKNLTFDEGRITGHIRSDGLTIAPLFRVKVKFFRRNPEPIAPIIQPVVSPATFESCGADWSGQADERSSDITRWLLLADPHFGYHKSLRNGHLVPFQDRRACDLALQVAKLSRPDRISVVGDVLDLPDFSDKFLTEPEFRNTLQPALIECHWWLSQLSFLAKTSVHEGNHDVRLERAVIKHLEAMYDVRPADELHLPPSTSVPRLLGLDSIGVRWIGNYPSDIEWAGDDIEVKHGNLARKRSGDTAKAVIYEDGNTTSTYFGHAHRLELVSRTLWARQGARFIRSMCLGCLCHLDGRVPGSGERSNWQNGMAILDVHESGMSQVTPLLIEDGRTLYGGQVLVGRDYAGVLRDNWPEWGW